MKRTRPLVHRRVTLPRPPVIGGEPLWLTWAPQYACTLTSIVVIDEDSGFRERELLVDVKVLPAADEAPPLEACGVAVGALPRLRCEANDTIALRFYASNRVLFVMPVVEVDSAG